MSDALHPAAIEAARRYRHTDIVPRDAIWHRVQAGRRREHGSRHTRRFRQAAAAALIFGAGGMAGWLASEGRSPRAGAATSPSLPGEVRAFLASSDSLIRVFELTGNGGRVKAELGPWARDLLGRTRDMERLAHGDTMLVRLFADLDLVLLAMAQYAADPRPGSAEAALVEDAISVRGLPRQLAGLLGRDAPASGGG